MGAMNELKILDPNGHHDAAWDPDDAEQVQRARKIYEALMRRGYRAFQVEKDGAGRAQERFDPQERETLLVPPIHAG